MCRTNPGVSAWTSEDYGHVSWAHQPKWLVPRFSDLKWYDLQAKVSILIIIDTIDHVVEESCVSFEVNCRLKDGFLV